MTQSRHNKNEKNDNKKTMTIISDTIFVKWHGNSKQSNS